MSKPTLKQLLNQLREPVEIVVGFPMENQVIYPPDDRKGHHNKGGQRVGYIASVQEYGTKDGRIPSRPFLRTAMQNNKAKIKDMIVEALGQADTQAFDRIGISLVNMVRDSIRNGPWIPNAESTKIQKLKYGTKKLLKKTDAKSVAKVQAELQKIKPLIDRGIMLNSVSYTVRKG